MKYSKILLVLFILLIVFLFYFVIQKRISSNDIIEVKKSNVETINKNHLRKTCFIYKKFPKLFEGNTKVWLYDNHEETAVTIQSERCPPPLFSYLIIDKDGLINDFINCHKTTSEELVLHAGFEGEMTKSNRIKESRFDVAISGPGFFLEKCRKQFYLIRRGEFIIARDKTLITIRGCTIVDEKGTSFKMTSNKVDDQGCSSSQCLAIIQPDEGEFQFINRNRLKFFGNIQSSSVESPFIFSNQLENIEEDAGIMGPNFDLILDFDKELCR